MRRIPLAIVLLSLSALVCSGQNTVKDQYQTIEVNKFEVRSGVEFPPEYLPALQNEILKQMQLSKLFRTVARPGETPVAPQGNMIRLTGTIMRFDPGSQAKRFLIGMGTGSTRIFVHLVYLDQVSGKPIITEDANAIITGGLFTVGGWINDGGSSHGIIEQFARQVVTGAKVTAGKRLPEIAPVPILSATSTPAPTSPATLSSAPVPVSAVPTPDRHIVNFSMHDFTGTQTRLNKEAADGYRLADFARTGDDRADVILEKQASLAKYDYLILHTGGLGTMEKEMNQAAAEGYRLCSQTWGPPGGHWAVFAVVLEKSLNAAATRYTYRVHQTVRVSSLQNDTAKDQSDGYLLVASTSWAGIHLGVLEKEVKPDAAKPARE